MAFVKCYSTMPETSKEYLCDQHGVKVVTVPLSAALKPKAVALGQCIVEPPKHLTIDQIFKLKAYLIEKSENFGDKARLVLGPLKQRVAILDAKRTLRDKMLKAYVHKKAAYLFDDVPPEDLVGPGSGKVEGYTYELPMRGSRQVVPGYNNELSQEVKDYIEDLDLDEIMPVLIDDEENVAPPAVAPDEAGPSRRVDPVPDATVDPKPIEPEPVAPEPAPCPPVVNHPDGVTLLAAIAKNTDKVPEMCQTVENLAGHVSVHEGKITRLEARNVEQDGKIERLEAEVSDLKDRFAKLETTQIAQGADIIKVKDELSALRNFVDEVRATLELKGPELDDIVRRLNEIESMVNQPAPPPPTISRSMRDLGMLAASVATLITSMSAAGISVPEFIVDRVAELRTRMMEWLPDQTCAMAAMRF